MTTYRMEIVLRNLGVYERKKKSTYKALQRAKKQLGRGSAPFTVRPI